ncbi:hypothetical protein CFP56_039611 [Quercus suber]|uniref:Uncharacterized protein n=1 Tax=Quercus suber TaxID=58331 RepID=A0AAW0MBX3_QUESU
MDVLGQTVLHVQNQLLTHLESMNPLEHESMTQVVESTFIVLDRLLVNYTPFQELVKEFIACASSFADIEQSINNERSFQELMERYHSEKVRYDDISRIHDEIMTAFADSNRRLHSLREEASCVKELLLRIENQLSSCEAETKELETRVGEVSRDMLESQKSLQTASQEAEEATKLCHQREQKRNAAKAALEMARIKLRHYSEQPNRNFKLRKVTRLSDPSVSCLESVMLSLLPSPVLKPQRKLVPSGVPANTLFKLCVETNRQCIQGVATI